MQREREGGETDDKGRVVVLDRRGEVGSECDGEGPLIDCTVGTSWADGRRTEGLKEGGYDEGLNDEPSTEVDSIDEVRVVVPYSVSSSEEVREEEEEGERTRLVERRNISLSLRTIIERNRIPESTYISTTHQWTY